MSAGEPVWCRPCQSLLRHRLVELDDLAAKIGAALDQRRSGPGEKVSGTRTRPSPSAAVDDLDELLHTLLGWEDAYREARSLPPRPRRGRFAPTLAGTVAWLAQHLDGLLAFDGAADFGREILDLHRRLRSSNRTGAPRRPTAACPDCDLMTVSPDPHADEVRCGACGWTSTAHPRKKVS
ncbi:hypothetical protein [Actinomadura spongiicola]|uniref:hypothetical protein n=1 Tax=Actinomadura spongiicola TaxID=2303421 RepID=UPI0013148EF2|nr:hypothetical protein [Actinomadura spongiicola]